MGDTRSLDPMCYGGYSRNSIPGQWTSAPGSHFELSSLSLIGIFTS